MRAMKRTATEDAANALLLVVADPKKYQKRLDELADRRAAVEEAEAQASERESKVKARELNVAEREEHAVKVTAEVHERRGALEADETVLAERTVEIENREAAADNLEVSLAEREVAIEDKIQNALASVRALFVAGLEPLVTVTTEIVESAERAKGSQ